MNWLQAYEGSIMFAYDFVYLGLCVCMKEADRDKNECVCNKQPYLGSS